MSVCTALDCDRKARARNLCNKHYMQAIRRGTLKQHATKIHVRRAPGDCKIEGCDGMHRSLGFCSKHYSKYVTEQRRRNSKCGRDGCDRQQRHGDGMCSRHHREAVSGIPANPARPTYTIAERDAITEKARRMRDDGMSFTAIGDELGISWTTARRWINEAGTTTCISDDDLEEFEFLCSFGTSPERVAKRLGLSLSAIERARMRAAA